MRNLNLNHFEMGLTFPASRTKLFCFLCVLKDFSNNCANACHDPFSDKSFDLRRGIEGVLFHECSIRKEMCPAPCWRNKSIIPIPPSDGGPYLTSVWIVMLKPGRGRPYFMGAAIT